MVSLSTYCFFVPFVNCLFLVTSWKLVKGKRKQIKKAAEKTRANIADRIVSID